MEKDMVKETYGVQDSGILQCFLSTESFLTFSGSPHFNHSIAQLRIHQI